MSKPADTVRHSARQATTRPLRADYGGEQDMSGTTQVIDMARKTSQAPARAGGGSVLTGLGKLTGSEFRLMLRDPGLIFVAFIPVLLVMIFGLLPSTSSPSADFNGGRFIDYYLPPIVTMVIGMMALNALTSVLATYRERGILRRLAVTPVRPVALMLAQGLVNLASLTAVTAGVLALANLAFDVPVPRQFLGFVVAFLLCVSAMFAVGLLISALAPTGKAANGIGTMAFFPLAFLAGVWTPGPMMPDVVRHISDFSPLGAGSQAILQAWQGSFPEPLHIAVLLAYTVGLGFVSSRLFRWE